MYGYHIFFPFPHFISPSFCILYTTAVILPTQSLSDDVRFPCYHNNYVFTHFYHLLHNCILFWRVIDVCTCLGISLPHFLGEEMVLKPQTFVSIEYLCISQYNPLFILHRYLYSHYVKRCQLYLLNTLFLVRFKLHFFNTSSLAALFSPAACVITSTP